MLFQACTGGQPVELVYILKSKASQDPLGEAEEANKSDRPRKRRNEDGRFYYINDRETSGGPNYNDDEDMRLVIAASTTWKQVRALTTMAAITAMRQTPMRG